MPQKTKFIGKRSELFLSRSSLQKTLRQHLLMTSSLRQEIIRLAAMAKLDLPISAVEMMLLIDLKSPVNIKVLQQFTGLSRQHLWTLLHDLKTKEIISMTARLEDKRQKIINLTPRGKALIRQVTSTLLKETYRALRSCQASEIDGFQQVSQRLAE